ncbi:MAG: hypothetical protein H0U73_02765 [Tatlockia sp.]|nr:hypothetical protein [Tatlockia sp.]
MMTNHKSIPSKLATLFAVIFVVFMFLPALGYFFHFTAGTTLFGYVENQTTKPEAFLKGWFDKKLQLYLEEKINTNVGFKPLLIRLFNDLSFRLFAEQQRTNLYSTKEHGLYSEVSLTQLNREYLKRDTLAKVYDDFAIKLSQIQRLFAAKGKHFVVIISASKPYVHLEGLSKRFLVSADNNFYDKMASLGKALKKHGVNVVDSAPILREFYQKKGIETHANSGVHWNYYSGCITVQHLYNNLRESFANAPKVHCGKPKFEEPTAIDLDGFLFLNTYTKVNLLKATPYPSPSATIYDNYLPKMLIVGDSFMHQLITALDEAKSYSNIVISQYFSTDIKHKPGEILQYITPPTSEGIEKGVLDAAVDSDVVILEMVDYNIPRLGFGFAESFLKRLKETAPKVLT